MVYFGFAMADGMFPGTCAVSRRPLSVEEVRHAIGSATHEPLEMCLNPSHKATIEAARRRFGLNIWVPDKAPIVSLRPGDRLVLMSVRGLPRMEGRHEYTKEEIDGAEFSFGEWTVS